MKNLGETFVELIENIKEAVALHFEGVEPPPDVLLLSEVKLRPEPRRRVEVRPQMKIDHISSFDWAQDARCIT